LVLISINSALPNYIQVWTVLELADEDLKNVLLSDNLPTAVLRQMVCLFL
jgi:hypothetical protein